MRSLLALTALGLLSIGGTASAEPAYKADDVVRFLSRSQKLGEERRICIGSMQECADMKTAAQQPFDMLVTFDLNSDRLTSGARENLSEFAKALKSPDISGLKLRVEGHTDARGTEELNNDLSRRRAKAVVAFLELKGVPGDRLNAMGFGKSAPRTNDAFEPVNRRVETRIDYSK